jgi:hypothetical protein
MSMTIVCQRIVMANLYEDHVPFIQYALDICVSGLLGTAEEAGKDVKTRIWTATGDCSGSQFG